EGQFTESLVAQLMEKVMKEKQSLEQGAMQPSFKSVTGDDGSSMAAGFMQWENAFFPWTLNYDEIDMVLEGELHV
ncbi:ethanolamine utilization acetate kinase EutQ, partial [Escherichia coli]|nr:ethanolamine utilization acetate kinase EutQ [Escherichia coli]